MNDSIEEQPIEVKALENFLLYIKFKNNEEKIYDMKEMLKFDYYKNLRNKENFKKVKVFGITLDASLFSTLFFPSLFIFEPTILKNSLAYPPFFAISFTPLNLLGSLMFTS